MAACSNHKRVLPLSLGIAPAGPILDAVANLLRTLDRTTNQVWNYFASASDGEAGTMQRPCGLILSSGIHCRSHVTLHIQRRM
jgi:hypothetical protein